MTEELYVKLRKFDKRFGDAMKSLVGGILGPKK